MKSFPIARETINGEEYILMNFDVFYMFFNEMAKHKNIDQDTVKQINLHYEKSKRIKKKRIKFKKQKQLIMTMYNLIF